MGRRTAHVEPNPPESVAALYWTYEGRDELRRRLSTALERHSKAQLISLLQDTAFRWEDVCRQLLMETEDDQPLSGLVGDIRSALRKATHVPEEQVNRNLSVDYNAYEQVRRGLKKLIATDHLREAMALAIDVIQLGSNQVELSDEGLMADEVVETVKLVVKEVDAAQIGPEEKAKWWVALAAADWLELLSGPSSSTA
jgi:hypothetical protein